MLSCLVPTRFGPDTSGNSAQAATATDRVAGDPERGAVVAMPATATAATAAAAAAAAAAFCEFSDNEVRTNKQKFARVFCAYRMCECANV